MNDEMAGALALTRPTQKSGGITNHRAGKHQRIRHFLSLKNR
ncbi:hypothetical protein BN134_2349 [Cronobacter dublinensis 1210]|uniref:Uncharacterized protein n=1 Tax=Cronobacter dublinensis 1210 TaxID=1208656 RepID=A0ABP1WAN6_9ENTR|nr:hypothetical protein BN134_2349 [Cronobacter dublinensis 1210]